VEHDPQDTATILAACHRGDPHALATLVQRDLAWVRGYVSRRLGVLLRRRNDTQDVVQEAMVEILRSGPRFIVSDRDACRALVAKIVENAIRRAWRHQAADRRDVRREESLPVDETVLDHDRGATHPSEAAGASEMRAWVRLALELLDPDERTVIVLREYRDLAFREIAQLLGTSEDAARMRFSRAVSQLARCMDELRAQRIVPLCDEAPPEPNP
jgi:RNA polymerase sigma-70 factor, ECF subfamily